MSAFVMQALAEKLTRDVREVESLGYAVKIMGGLVLIEPTGKATEAELSAVKAAVEAAGSEKPGGRKPKAGGRKKKAAKEDDAAGPAENAGETCTVETQRGPCGGTLNRNGNCPKCAQRAYAKANYEKTRGKKA